MKLVIVESPSKSKTIQKYLGDGYKVLASGGHICDLPEKSLGIDLQNNYKPEYEVNKDKKDTIKKLKAAMKGTDEVYLATDPDREGEAISWHLANVLELENPKRIEFNEISSKAVNAALQKPRQLNLDLINSQQARRVLDRLVGYKISPVLNKKIKSGLSGGRVQSAALKMIVDREREVTAFVPEEYWNIFAMLLKKAKGAGIKAALNDYNGKKIKVTSEVEAKAVEKNLKGAEWIVDSVKRGVSKSRPFAPFTTSTLQQDGSQRLGISAPEVMKLAQQLYEGINIEGEGQTALVTYIRTDSVRVSSDAQKEALDFIKSVYGEEYTPKKPNFYSTKASGVQDAHEAIRPIALDKTPELLKAKIGRNHYRLYKLIYDRFIASQMTDAVYNTLNVHINAGTDSGVYGFKVGGKTLVFRGYTAAYDNSVEDEEEAGSRLPDLTEGEKLDFKELKSEQKFTKPPSRFTDATLVKAMEENGIGRPSTYASVISVLAKREYTVKEQKNIKPTPLGETVVEFMEKNFADIVDSKFTAGMETKLDTIQNGEEWQKIIADFYPPFEKNVKMAYSLEKKVKMEDEVTDVVCDKCGALMVIRSSRYGRFMACPNYPKCKNIKNIVETVGKCPRCGGDIVKKRTRAGKTFYGCGKYPECDFMSWEVPAPHLCPKCNGVMRITQKGDNKSYVCINKTCGHTIILTNDGD
ncbi:MAG: type I DNA topoisomerase [Clostridia bacterium]|nr:type I DNA topoisomerase [Clostridia bacterium]